MRIPVLFLSLFAALSVTSGLSAQNPGAQQDAEAAREKLLNAADQLENIQANSEATKTSMEGVKTQVAQMQAEMNKLETENAGLKQQLADMQAAFEQYKADQVKSRQALIDNVADMLAAKPGTSKTKKTEKTQPVDAASTAPPAVKMDTAMTAPSLSPPADPASFSPDPDPMTDAPPRPQKGYYHVVEKGETLKMICSAYRDKGVEVTLSDVRKANGLTEKSVLKPGQKLFIPKPGT